MAEYSFLPSEGINQVKCTNIFSPVIVHFGRNQERRADVKDAVRRLIIKCVGNSSPVSKVSFMLIITEFVVENGEFLRKRQGRGFNRKR